VLARGRMFVADIVEGYGVIVQGSNAPTDVEWDEVLAFYQTMLAADRLRVLVYTEGAAPNASQRGKLQDQLGKKKMIFAVITPSAWARAVGTAVSWFVPNVAMFHPNELEKALDHLGVAAQTRAGIRERFDQLRGALQGLPGVAAR